MFFWVGRHIPGYLFSLVALILGEYTCILPEMARGQRMHLQSTFQIVQETNTI